MDSTQLNELILKMNGLERAVYGLNKLKSNILANLLKYYYLTRYFLVYGLENEIIEIDLDQSQDITVQNLRKKYKYFDNIEFLNENNKWM